MTSKPPARRSRTAASRSVAAVPPRRTPGGLEQRLLSRARGAGFSGGDRLVVGFSGGRDSLTLAAALRRAATALQLELHLVHVDHRLRPASADDARRAALLAEALGLPYSTIALAESPTEAHPGVGVEEAARRSRYQALGEVAARWNARAIVTAHHLEDQAETVLLHLLRGAGVHGAAGMAERAPSPWRPVGDATAPDDISREAAWIWRPLLAERRSTIDAYIADLGLRPIEDETNADIALRRNALRQTIIPLLEQAVPGARNALARYAALAAEDDLALEEVTDGVLASAVDERGGLSAASVQELSAALQRRLVRRWLLAATGLPTVSADRTDAVVQLALAARGGCQIEIGEGWIVVCHHRLLHAQRIGNVSGREA